MSLHLRREQTRDGSTDLLYRSRERYLGCSTMAVIADLCPEDQVTVLDLNQALMQW